MRPGKQLTTLRPDLAGGIRAFDTMANEGGFIAHQVFPVTEVAKQSGTFPKIDLKESLQSPETRRGSRAEYNEIGWKFTDDNYATQDHGLQHFIDDRDAEIYSEYFDAEVEGAELVVSNILLAEELRAATTLFNPTTFSGKTAGVTNEWDDFSAATPITDVDNAVETIYDNSGVWANALVISHKVFRNLSRCDEILEAIASSGAGDSILPGKITAAQLAQAFRLDRVIVGGGTKNTANQGQTAVPGQIWSGEYALVCRVVTEPGKFKQPGIGRTFHWDADGSQVGGTIESWRVAGQRGGWVRARHEVQQKLMLLELGYLLSNITT
ncbi:MAG: hypothetical protein HYV27_15285 [Candidatus Hydrogenedentes bacterium]|nr:hypothetical protein [Candidatus Hydrogenedentota bacterium]